MARLGRAFPIPPLIIKLRIVAAAAVAPIGGQQLITLGMSPAMRIARTPIPPTIIKFRIVAAPPVAQSTPPLAAHQSFMLRRRRRVRI